MGGSLAHLLTRVSRGITQHDGEAAGRMAGVWATLIKKRVSFLSSGCP